ncbi:dynein axonemal heavy chain 14 isoform X1 [Struthio camelus]|uniref:dynein axonemal heavy chain 14 isoform X1 n=2 Tax=Struthio camelus TaxID=8801 RepID=UPI003603ED23
MDAQNKMLKEKLMSRLQFEPGRTEVPHMLNGRYIMGEPPDSSKKDNSELSSSVEKKYSILRTAVYRGSTERKHKTVIKEVSRKHKEERGESLCQPTGVSEHETMNLNGSITQMVSLMSQNENLKTTLSTTSVSKGGNISTEMQTAVLEPSCSKKICEQPKAERSSNKPLRKRVPSYDRTEPIDDDVIMHILRLRGKLGWETKLPSGERLAGEADVTRHQKFAFMKPLLLKDSGEYVYCLRRDRNSFKAPYNPYELQAVSVNTARQNKEYWTVTASFVSKFSAEHKLGEIEMIPVPQWLRERQLYYKLISFNLFSNFRMKKYFSVWKINVKRSKANKSESI